MTTGFKIDPPTKDKIKRLLECSNPSALAELNRVALKLGLATPQTDAEAVKRRLAVAISNSFQNGRLKAEQEIINKKSLLFESKNL